MLEGRGSGEQQQKNWMAETETFMRFLNRMPLGNKLDALNSPRMVPYFNIDVISSLCNVVEILQKNHVELQRFGYIQCYAAMSSKYCQSPSPLPEKTNRYIG